MHAESYFAASGKRSFDVEINGRTMRENLDIRAEVGKDAPLKLDFSGIYNDNGFQSPANSVPFLKFNVIGPAIPGGWICCRQDQLHPGCSRIYVCKQK